MRQPLLLALVLSLAASAHPGTPDLRSVKLQRGATSLLDVGTYRIGYQRAGHDVEWLPVSWTGNFTDFAGVAFLPRVHEGRPAVLLHCPWKRGSGPAFVDFPLELPQTAPITLSFAIAMRHDVATVDGEVVKSDGVTFSAALTCDGKTRELMREHYTVAAAKPFEFDLSLYAGKRVVLRIQTEPGPKMSASWDFSRFIDPKIIAGSADDTLSFAIGEMTKSKAYQVLSKASLLRVNNRSGQGITPSCKVDHKADIEPRRDGGCQFVYRGDDCRVVFAYSPKTGTLDDLTATVDGAEPFLPCAGGGVSFESGAPETAKLVSSKINGNALNATWQYTKGDESATATWVFRLVGKALVIGVRSDDLTLARVSLGRVAGVGLRRTIPIPYLYYQTVSYLPVQRTFAMSHMDWTKSRASEAPGPEARYHKKLDGKRNRLSETGYVAVSPDLDEVLPNIPHPASPFLELLGPKLMLDMWTGEQYDVSAKWLERYKSYGFDEVAIIYHVWQRYGYDVKLPDHIPANPKMGGDEKMRILGATAKRLGYPFSLHENYIDLYPDAPSYTEDAAARRRDGTFWKAWYHKGTKVQSWGLRPTWALEFAKQNSPEIHKRYQTTAAYLDVHTCIQPWRYCDFDPAQPNAGEATCRRELQAKLFQYMRDVHTGPLFGEGSRHFFWAGLVDGVEAQVDGGEDRPVLVSFDLLKLHPQMVNHGMGYYSRWLRTRRETKWGVDAPTPEQMDKYRAQEIAYGHAAFLGSPLYYNLPHAIREYHLVQPVQALYGDAKVTAIAYEVDGQMVTSSVAAVVGILDRLRVQYDSGLTLHVNLRAADWQVEGYTLPQFGFLAQGPDLLAYTAKRDGTIVDYARTKDSLFADSRSEVMLPWAYRRKRIEPGVKAFEYLGANRFKITYEWRVDDVLDRDLHCFVHFQDLKNPDTAKGILSQNDHRPPRPTTEWKPGMVLADGPHVVTVPDKCTQRELHILVGLHKAGRVGLSGVSAGSSRIAIGRLLLTREGGRITNIALADVDDLRGEQEAKQKRFIDRMNRAGTRIDFGPAATDGSFKLAAKPRRLELLPFPRDRKFRVELDLREVLSGAMPAQVALRGFDIEGREVRRERLAVAAGRLALTVGDPGAVRYAVSY